MEPEQSPTPNNDVDSLLRDAVTPLPYRSAVRALLGMPEAEGENLTFARMVPPTEFQYHLPPSTVAASASPHSLEGTVPAAFDETQTREQHSAEGILGEATPVSWPIETLRKWLLDTPPTTAVPRSSPLEQHPAPAQDAGAPATRARASVAAPVTATQAGDALEHTSIAVPGISARSQYFPALAPEKAEDRPASTAMAPSPRQIVPGDPHLQTAEYLSSPDQAQMSLTEVTSKIQARGNQNETAPPLDLHPFHLPSPAMSEGEAEAIEQLQRTVRELAAQVAAWQTRTPPASQRQQTEPQPPRRAERVVVIKQAAQPLGPPRAFWERSYLGHLSWRSRR